jgi:hypothetical protein
LSATEATAPLGAGAPLALILGLEPVRGYNPLDNRRYKEYLQFIAGAEESMRSGASDWTYPVLGNFPVVNQSLLNLLGVRYLLQPADWPCEGSSWRKKAVAGSAATYNFIAGGQPNLGPYALYINDEALPRAFVVSRADPLPDRAEVLSLLKQADFRRHVWLEEFHPSTPALLSHEEDIRPAEIKEYRPNRVAVRVHLDAPGYLVLTDIWYSGWTCSVNGEPVPLYRANYLFRAISLPAGDHEVVFSFLPQSYRKGRLITCLTLMLVAVAMLLALGYSTFRRFGRTRGMSGFFPVKL